MLLHQLCRLTWEGWKSCESFLGIGKCSINRCSAELSTAWSSAQYCVVEAEVKSRLQLQRIFPEWKVNETGGEL